MFFTNLLRDVFVLPKMPLLAAGAMLLWLGGARRAFNGERVFQSRQMDSGILAMGVALLFSTVLSIDVPLSLLGPHQGQFHSLVPLLLCALIFYGVSYSNVSEEDVSLALLVASILVSLWAIVQRAGYDRILWWSIQDGRSGSFFGSPIFLGSFLAMVLPIAWCWFLKTGWRSSLGIAAGCLAFLALAAARSRGGAASAGAGFLIYGVIYFDIPLMAMLPVLALGAASGAFISRLHPASDLGRFEVWKTAVAIWKHYPVFGSGPDTFGLSFRHFATDKFIAIMGNTYTIQTSAHNDILQVLSTMGTVGIVAYLYLFWKASGVAVAASRRSDDAKAITASLVALFIQAKVNPIALPVLAIVAALLGVLDRPEIFFEANWAGASADTRSHRTISVIGSELAMTLLGTSARMCQAERYERLADISADRRQFFQEAQDFNLAAQVNPLDLHYTQMQLNALWAVMPGLPPSSYSSVAVASMIISDRAVLLHPNDSTAHEIRAVSLKMRGWKGDIEEADREIAEASRLAPTCMAYLQWRAALAVTRKDAAVYKRSEDEVSRLKSLLGRSGIAGNI